MFKNYGPVKLVYLLLVMLVARWPGKREEREVEEFPSVLHLAHGLVLGLLLSRLIQENVSDVVGQKILQLLISLCD